MTLLRASAAPTWMNCSLSGRLDTSDGALPDDTSESAMEGTCAAWVAEEVINKGTDVWKMEGRTHENGWTADKDMVRHVSEYVSIIRKRINPKSEVYREQNLSGLKVAGTLDAQGWENAETLCIDDLKYGYDIVEPTSWQLKVYMALWAWNWKGALPREIKLGIFQPRAVHHMGPYRQITIKAEDVIPILQKIVDRVENIASGDHVGSPGDHCRHCSAANICDALTKSVYAMWQPVSERTYTNPTDRQLADELDMLDRMEKMFKGRKAAIEAEAEARMDQQRVIPGWAKMPTVGKRKFTIPDDAVEVLTGVDPWEKKICTPAELERRGAPKKIVDAISKQPMVGHKLRRVDKNEIEAIFKRGMPQ